MAHHHRHNALNEYLLHLSGPFAPFSKWFAQFSNDHQWAITICLALATFLFAGLFIFILRDEVFFKKKDEEGTDDDDGVEEFDYNRMMDKKRDEDILYGKTDKYEWQQGPNEVELFFPLEDLDKVKRKDIKVDITSTKLVLSIADKVELQGDLYAEVIPGECNWQIEEGVKGGRRTLWITLYKKLPTTRSLHWRCVLQGDEQVDTKKQGPAVISLDTSNPEEMRKTVQTFQENYKNSKAASNNSNKKDK